MGGSTARAYFCSSSEDPENLARAEAALQELVTSLDTCTDHVRAVPTFHVLGFHIISGKFRVSTAPMDEISSFETA